MIVTIVKETFPNEKRVALVPQSVAPLKKAGAEVVVEAGAGEAALQPDAAYEAQGARLERDRRRALAAADVLLTVRGPGAHPDFAEADLDALQQGAVLIGFLEPLAEPGVMKALAERGLTVFAVELIPRITRAQSMDALSSMANIAGYRAVLLAAGASPKMFPMMMTAAGTITPAKVFVLGAGVAGLQAIATAKRLGAVVDVYDVRPAVKGEVQSLGGRFVELNLETAAGETAGGYAAAQTEEFYRRQQSLLAKHLEAADVIITTAAVPGKRAPVLIPEEVVNDLKAGAVIVDLAAEKGGNCALTRSGETIVRNGVTIIGAVNVPSEAAYHASQMYSRNVTAFLTHMIRDGKLALDSKDEIVEGTLVCRDGSLVHSAVREALEKGDS
jgi:NAD(P) transhydrogenase subunit alpha